LKRLKKTAIRKINS